MQMADHQAELGPGYPASHATTLTSVTGSPFVAPARVNTPPAQPQLAAPPCNPTPITVSSQSPSLDILICSKSLSPAAFIISSRSPTPGTIVRRSASVSIDYVHTSCHALTTAQGLPKATFDMTWQLCSSCEYLVPQELLHAHICDLTMD